MRSSNMGRFFCIVLVAFFMYSSVSQANMAELRKERLDHIAGLPWFDSFIQAYQSGDFAGAVVVLNDMINAYPDESYLYYLRGAVSMELKNYADARSDLAYYNQLIPDDIDGYKINVYACIQDKAYEDAMYYCQRGLAINPNHTYLLKSETFARERLEAERRRESFNSIGSGEDNPYMQEILQFINDKRRQSGQSELSMHAVLNQAAQKRAYELVESFSQTRPDGSPFVSIMREFDIPYHFAGEVLYKSGGGIDGAIAGWRQQYTNKDFGIDPDTQYVGIGCVEQDGVSYLVQIFMF